jgi:c-di-GMP-binding flagellar brake protein YcgR
VRTRIQLSAEVDTFKDRFTAATRDLSVGGAGLDLDRPLREGAQLSLSLFVVLDDVEDEQTAPLTVRARVAWCAESDEEGRYAAGVRFDDMMPQQRDWLARFLAALAAT